MTSPSKIPTLRQEYLPPKWRKNAIQAEPPAASRRWALGQNGRERLTGTRCSVVCSVCPCNTGLGGNKYTAHKMCNLFKMIGLAVSDQKEHKGLNNLKASRDHRIPTSPLGPQESRGRERGSVPFLEGLMSCLEGVEVFCHPPGCSL